MKFADWGFMFPETPFRTRQVSYHMGAVSLLKTDIKMPFTTKTQSKIPLKRKVTVENMIYDKAISRGDRVKVIPLATLKDIKKQRKKLNFR